MLNEQIKGFVNIFKRGYHSILFEITQRCNLNCMYCYNVWKDGCKYPEGELSTRDVKRVLAKIIEESGCKIITLTGGEPLMREDINEIVAFLKGKSVRINIITNGMLLTERVAKECIGAGVWLHVSCYVTIPCSRKYKPEMLSFYKSILEKYQKSGVIRKDTFEKLQKSFQQIDEKISQ